MSVPTWEQIAEAVKMPGGRVAVTRLDGTKIVVTAAEFSQIVQAGIGAKASA